MNKTFQVEIIETLSKTVTVKAKDELSALQKVKEHYKTESIVLDTGNYVATEFMINSMVKDNI